jgi:hypothetical protein
MKKLLLFTAIMALFLSACSSASLEGISEITNSGTLNPLDQLAYNWGDISIDGGDVEHGFHFTNAGEEDLILKGMTTSCMCTEAYIELPNGSISPTFGMHENEDWAYAVKPGEEFEVEVIYDPIAHGPNGVGAVTRSVFLTTSDEDSVLEMKVGTNVLYDVDYQEKYSDEAFSFEKTEFDFGVLKQSSGITSHDFAFTYTGADPITVTAVPTSCACASAEISQNEFETGDTGILTVFFDPNLHEEPEGVFFKTVSLLTEPSLDKQPEVKIWAEIDLDLGEEFYKLSEHKD